MVNLLNGEAKQVESPKIQLPADLVELTARKFCKRISVNPDDEVQVPHPQVLGTFKMIKQWQYFAPQLANQMVELEVIFAAQQEYEQLQQNKFVLKMRHDFESEVGPQEWSETAGYVDQSIAEKFRQWIDARMQAEKH